MSKQRVIVEAVLAGKSQRAVAKQYGVSQPRVSQLVAAWRSGGWVALETQSRRPKRSPHATPPSVVEQVLHLRAQLASDGCDAGPHSIHALLTRQAPTSPPPSPATIWRILTRAGRIIPEPKKRPRTSYRRFEAELPNECWQADFTHWKLANGNDIEILLWLDDHSRFLISATCHKPVTGGIVLDTFRTACDTHGIPASTLTDNGLVFTTRFRHGPNGFGIERRDLGIEQKNGRPNHPQTQGNVERLNQTLKKWLAAQPPAASRQILQQQVDRFVTHYNQQRPHRSLAGATPAEAYTARAKATPGSLDGHFRIRDDKVYATGNVTLRRGGKMHHIGIGIEHAGKPIRMLIHDLDITIIDRETSEILRELVLDPTRNHQPRGAKPGPKKGTPRTGGMPKGYHYDKPRNIRKSRDIR